MRGWGSGEFVHIHLVLRVGAAEVVFGCLVEAVFVVLEQVRELQQLVLPMFDILCLAGLEAGLKQGVDLQRGDRWRGTRNERPSETNLLNLLNGGVLEFDHGGGSCQSCDRHSAEKCAQDRREQPAASGSDITCQADAHEIHNT